MFEIFNFDGGFAAVEKPLVKIRRMTPDDAEAVYALAEECRLEFWSKDDYQMEAERKDGFAAVAVFEGKPIGFIVSRLIMSYQSTSSEDEFLSVNKNNSEGISSSELEAEIYNIAVNSGFTRNGIGRKLLAALYNYILTYIAATAVLWLEVRESNALAIDFYRADGFEVCYRRYNFYERPAEDALVMKKQIDTAVFSDDFPEYLLREAALR